MTGARSVIVVGGGIVGLSAAWHLAREGADVTVLDAGSLEGSASTGNAGLVALGHPPMPQPKLIGRTLRLLLDPLGPLYIRPRADPALLRWFLAFRRACSPRMFARSMAILAEMGRHAGSAFDQIVDEGGIDCAYRRTGWLEVYATPSGRTRVHEACKPEIEHGFTVSFLEDGALQQKFPLFRDDVIGAAHHLDSRWAHPDAFIAGLAARVREAGAALHLHTPVVRLLIERGRCAGVELADGRSLRADRTILAAGIWSTQVAQTAGLRLPMEAGKGYHVSVPDPGLAVAGVMSESYVAVTPMAGRLRLAGTVEFSGINQTLRPRRLAMLPLGAARYLKAIDRSDVRDAWCGLRPCTADGLPAIGRTKAAEHLLIGTGHAMMGFALGPVTGRFLADLALDQQPAMDLAPFDPDRFV